MVYMHFPHNLSEEEELLQKKYAKLKKKKKALAEMRKPKVELKEQPKEQLKRKAETAANATEQAKKLLKLGAIKVNTEKKDTQTFKRTKRQKLEDKSTVGFQPFSPTQGGNEEDPNTPTTPGERGGMAFQSDRPDYRPPERGSGLSDRGGRGRPKPRGSLYDNFVSSRNRDERKFEDRREMPPKKGNTIYVYGINITEDLVKKAFSKLGAITNIAMESEKNCAFVTFEKMEVADEAIAQINGSMVSGVQLSVQMARRQPTFEPTPTEPASSNSWSSIAASQSQKGSHQDKRDLVAYDDTDPFS